MNFSSSSSRPLQLKQLDESTVDFLAGLSRVRRRWSRQRRSAGDSLRAMCVEKASALPLLTIPASDSLSAVVEAYTRWLVVDCDSKPVYMTWTSRSKAMGTSQGGKLIRPLMSPSKRSNGSMTPSCNDNEEEDFYLLRRAERRLLRLFYLSHKTAELETGSLILPIDRLPAALSLLSLLSRDQAFLHKPLTLPNGEVTMPWLLGTSVFSAAQFIASQLEVQLQHLGIGGDKGSTPSSAAFDQAKSKNALVSSQLLSGLAGTDASPLRKDRLLESAMLGGLKNTLKSSDAEKLKCILSVSYKRYTDFFPLKKMSSYHETMHRLFMLTYTLSQPPVYNDGSTVRCTIFPSIKPLSSVTVAPLMGTPLKHAFSSLQELSFDIFKRIYERSVSVYLSKLWIEGTEAKGKVSTPLSKQKKKKKKSSNLKSHASQREEVVHNNTKSLLHSSSLSLNLGIAPASVTRKEQEATERVVLVTQIIEDVINIALSLVHEVCLAPKSPAIPEKGSTLGCLERLPSKTTSAYAQAHAESSPTSSPIPPTLALDERAGLYENTDIFYSNDPVFNSVPAAPQTSTGNYYHYWQPQQQQEEFRTSFMLPLPDTTLVSFADLSSSSPLEDRHNIFNGFWDGSSVSERQMSVGGGFEDEPEADDADYGPFTTAALRAHTVYHESLLKEETMKRSGFAVGNRSEGFVAAAVTSSKMRNSLGATHRQRGRSMFAPSTGKEKHRREDQLHQGRLRSYSHEEGARQLGVHNVRSDQQAVEADGDMISSFNSESHCGAFNPVVTVVLSSRLLISEGKRAAGINQQAVLNAVIAQMQSPPQPIYAYHARNIVPSLLSPHFDAMSEDGAAAHRNAFEPTHQKNKTQVKTKTMPDESALMGQRRHVSVSPAALEARSISSLPTRIIYHNKIPRPVAVATSRMEKGAALRDHQQVGASWSQQYAFQRNRSFSIHPDGNFTGAMLNTDAIIGGDGPMASPSPRKSPVGEAASDNMNISDDEDILLSSLLAQEIDDFVIKLDAADAALRAVKSEAVIRMRAVVRSLWPRSHVKPFGSFISGLSLPSSDLDLVICLPKVHQEAAPESSGALEGRNAVKETWQQNLARALRNETWVAASTIKIIHNVPVPVIKFKTAERAGVCSVNLDISFESAGHRGLDSNKLVSSLMQTYPSLRPLVLVLKSFLTRRGLCEAFTGGLSSYALLLLTTRFLQELEHSEICDVGAVLLGFLKYVGEDFNPRHTGISIGRRCYFPRAFSGLSGLSVNEPQRYPNMSAMAFIPFKFDPLFIEDPLTAGNNVGRNCFRILQVQRTLSEAYHAIQRALKCTEKDGIAFPLLEKLFI